VATQTSRKRAERPAIVRKPGLRGGSPTIAGTGIRVSDVVNYLRLHGSPRGVQKALPHLTLAQIRTALSFYDKNKDEIDQYISEEDDMASEFTWRLPST
jgi:uncharacterized protein (DUF433 family)